VSYSPNDRYQTTMCAACHRATHDLTHCRSTDEYLCEPCIMALAEQHYDQITRTPSLVPLEPSDGD